MADDLREPETKVLYRGESEVVYCFNFANEPQVANGETMSNPTVVVVNGIVLTAGSFGTPEVLTSDFTDLDENGNVVGTVAAGKGIKVAVTTPSVASGTKGDCTAVCYADLSGGGNVSKPVKFRVK